MKKHYLGIVKGNEVLIDWCLNQYDENIRAIKNVYGYASYLYENAYLDSLVAAYYCIDSKHNKSDKLFDVINGILAYMDKNHRPNYTVDMLESNFYAAPLFEAISSARAYRLMEKYAKTQRELDLLKSYFEYLPKVAYSLLNGGIHTPNHRWMGAASMMMMYNILGMEELKTLAQAYLNEGIDMDEFGEYTERSPLYNQSCDMAFMIIAQETGNMEYLEYSKKNMDLMFNYIDPDFTVFTQNSNRQDKHDGEINATTFADYLYYIYAPMAYLTNNGQYAAFADDIYKKIVKANGYGPHPLTMYMLDLGLKDFDPVLESYPTSYNIFHKDIVRFKKEDFSVTLLTRSPNFLFVQKGSLKCFVRICASFFAVAQYIPKAIEQIGKDTYQMTMSAHGEYYGPMPIKPATPVWKDMDHSLRPVNNKVDLEWTVTVEIKSDRVSLDVKTTGCDRVPCKIEFCLSASGKVEYDSKEYDALADEYICVNAKEVIITKDQDSLMLTDAFSEHSYHKDMRGSVAPALGAFTVYYTDFTHIEKKIDIIGKKKEKIQKEIIQTQDKGE